MTNLHAPDLAADVRDAFQGAGVHPGHLTIETGGNGPDQWVEVRRAADAAAIPDHAAYAALGLLGAADIQILDFPAAEYPFSHYCARVGGVVYAVYTALRATVGAR